MHGCSQLRNIIVPMISSWKLLQEWSTVISGHLSMGNLLILHATAGNREVWVM